MRHFAATLKSQEVANSSYLNFPEVKDGDEDEDDDDDDADNRYARNILDKIQVRRISYWGKLLLLFES